MAIALRRRQYLEILVARHLNDSVTGRRHEAMGSKSAREYSEMIGEFPLAVETVLKEYDGYTYEAFAAIHKRRHEYHMAESIHASKQGLEFLYQREEEFQKKKSCSTVARW